MRQARLYCLHLNTQTTTKKQAKYYSKITAIKLARKQNLNINEQNRATIKLNTKTEETQQTRKHELIAGTEKTRQ